MEEARKGDERQVWIASWKRPAPTGAPAGRMSLEKKLVWEQEEQILDVVLPADGMLVLSPSRVTLRTEAARNRSRSRQRGRGRAICAVICG